MIGVMEEDPLIDFETWAKAKEAFARLEERLESLAEENSFEYTINRAQPSIEYKVSGNPLTIVAFAYSITRKQFEVRKIVTDSRHSREETVYDEDDIGDTIKSLEKRLYYYKPIPKKKKD